LVFPCDHRRAPYFGQSCFNSENDFPDVGWLRAELRAGRINALGELEHQYLGLSPADPRMEPFWQLAEEFDVPVGIHIGPGPLGIAYESSPLWPPVKSPRYRMSVGDPLLLQEVLLKHQRLRLWVMHAGWPRLENMIALLSVHPGVYVDIAALQSEAVMTRPGYQHYLRELVESGFSKRIMFGSDFPDQVAAGIEAILAADFLNGEQKSTSSATTRRVSCDLLRRPANPERRVSPQAPYSGARFIAVANSALPPTTRFILVKRRPINSARPRYQRTQHPTVTVANEDAQP
jgi:hypothetical protein